MNRKTERRHECTDRDPMVASLVRFRNGTSHIKLFCNEHGRYLRFAPRYWLELSQLPKSRTTRAERIERGDPVGCRVCDDDVPLHISSAICRKCSDTDEGRGFRRRLRYRAKKLGISVFDVGREIVESLKEDIREGLL